MRVRGRVGARGKNEVAVNTAEATQDQVGKAETSVMTTAPVGLQVVLPLTCWQEVMQLAHDSSLGGHLGTKKILEQISRHFYSPSIRKDVQRFFFCRPCHACQVVEKSGGDPIVAPLQPLAVDPRWRRVNMQWFGTLGFLSYYVFFVCQPRQITS